MGRDPGPHVRRPLRTYCKVYKCANLCPGLYLRTAALLGQTLGQVSVAEATVFKGLLSYCKHVFNKFDTHLGKA